MSDVVIRVEGLSKLYRLGPRQRYGSLRDSLSELVKRPFRRGGRAPAETIWALRDVSFEVTRGDVLGIIGRNGAGKSTLLKILSRITEPTEGRAEVHGRVGSLLEVGTGFHPELTGRENIYLNGAILGMKRAEIERKFDEIVSFSEVEQFLDTQMKFYSSGMYVRLAFAVAAHLEPEILIVDEVLAVGDAAFQKKCLGKMGEVASEGRTVLLVSHNMGAIGNLCRLALLIDHGHLARIGPAREVVEAYLSADSSFLGERRWQNGEARPRAADLEITGVRILDASGAVSAYLDRREPFTVEIEYELPHTCTSMQVGFFVTNAEGVLVFVAGDAENDRYRGSPRAAGRWISRATVPGGLLNTGAYTLSVAADAPIGHTVLVERSVLRFYIEQTGIPLHGAHAGWRPAGVICLSLPWHIAPRSNG